MILFFPFDLLSHYLRCLQLAETMKEEQIMFPFSAHYQHLVEQKGFAMFPFRGLPVQEVMDGALNFRFTWMREELLETAFLEQVAILKHFRPRLVVGDASFTLRMAAAYAQVPYLSLINGYMSDYYALPRRLPPSHWAYRSFFFVPRTFYDKISVLAERMMMRRLHRPFRHLAKKYGLPPKQNLFQELQGERTLLLDLPLLFPQKHLPKHHAFIGPLCHSSDTKETTITKWLTRGKKTLFVSTGSSGDLSKFRFLADESFGHYQILVSGKGGDMLKAPHIFFQEFIHLESLLPQIDLFLCHAGNGTLYLALKAGIPVLCAPSHFEQEWNLQALEKMGWGARLKEPKHAKNQIHAWSVLKNTEAWKEKLPVIELTETKRLFRAQVEKLLTQEKHPLS